MATLTYSTKSRSRQIRRIEIGNNDFEFVLNFGQRISGYEKRAIHTRIITGPAYAKLLQRTLQGSVEAYESFFGAIGWKMGTKMQGTRLERRNQDE